MASSLWLLPVAGVLSGAGLVLVYAARAGVQGRQLLEQLGRWRELHPAVVRVETDRTRRLPRD